MQKLRMGVDEGMVKPSEFAHAKRKKRERQRQREEDLGSRWRCYRPGMFLRQGVHSFCHSGGNSEGSASAPGWSPGLSGPEPACGADAPEKKERQTEREGERERQRETEREREREKLSETERGGKSEGNRYCG